MAMFNSKTTQREQELEALLMQRDAELNDCRNRLAEASRAIAEYQHRESSIIGALTEAHASSQRMMDEAAVSRDQMLLEAQHNKENAEAEGRAALEQARQQANEVIADAQVQANEILAGAQAEANEIVAKAKGEYDACAKAIERMNARLTATAEDATRKIEDFKSIFVYDEIEPEEVTFSSYEAAPLYDVPVTYDVPQQPVFEAPQQPVFEAPQQPVFEAPQQPVFAAPVQQEDFFAEAMPIPEFAVEETVQTAPQMGEEPRYFASAPSPFDAPMPEPVPILKSEEAAYYQAQEQQGAQTVNAWANSDTTVIPDWTGEAPAAPAWDADATVAVEWTNNETPAVNDEDTYIPEQQPKAQPTADFSFDAELDALINDVLNN